MKVPLTEAKIITLKGFCRCTKK